MSNYEFPTIPTPEPRNPLDGNVDDYDYDAEQEREYQRSRRLVFDERYDRYEDKHEDR